MAATDQFRIVRPPELTWVSWLTGPHALADTDAVGVSGTDLGISFAAGEYLYVAFGDTFADRTPDSYGGVGERWRSNVLARTSQATADDGLRFDHWVCDESGEAREILVSRHDENGTGEITRIPTCGFALGSTLYLMSMSVREWGPDGYWTVNRSELSESRDGGETWSDVPGVTWGPDDGFVECAAHAAHDTEGCEWLYIWGVPAGRQGDVRLMRVRADASVAELTEYQYFRGPGGGGRASSWSSDAAEAAVVAQGPVGELSVLYVEFLDRWIMAYSERGRAYLREGREPWGPWSEPILIAGPDDYPVLYAPMLCPRFQTEGGKKLYLTLSIFGPYNVGWLELNLADAVGATA